MPTSQPASSKSEPADEPLPPLQYEAELPSSVRDAVYERFTGDLDAMVKRRLIRLGVTYNRTNYRTVDGDNFRDNPNEIASRVTCTLAYT